MKPLARKLFSARLLIQKIEIGFQQFLILPKIARRNWSLRPAANCALGA